MGLVFDFLSEYYLFIILVIIILSLSIWIYKLRERNNFLKEEINKIKSYEILTEETFWIKFYSPIIEFLNKYNFIIYFIISILFYISSIVSKFSLTINSIEVISNGSIKNILNTIATVILSSGVFSSITKSKHFLNIFSEEIRKIIYNEKFLLKQKDLDKTWTTFTKTICDKNFHKISDKLFDSIKLNYLPIDQKYYYEDLEVDIHIKFCKEQTDIVTVIEKTKVDIICGDNKKLDYKFMSNINYDSLSKNETNYTLNKFIVNGEDKTSSIVINKQFDEANEIFKIDTIYTLNTHFHKYSIYKEEVKTYSIKLNSNRTHSAMKIYNNIQLSIFYPSNLKVVFSKLGIENNWEKDEVTEITEDVMLLKAKIEGILFKNQGYMLNFLVK